VISEIEIHCQKIIRAAHDNYMRDIISPDAAKNPKKFWSFIKGKKQECMLSLKEVHMSLMVENGVAVNLLIYAVTSVLNSVILALSHRCIVLLVGLVRLGLMRVSILCSFLAQSLI
jgi:hypothetical protein